MIFKKIRFHISSHFLINYYLWRDIGYFSKKYNFEGKVLDLGCGQKPYSQFFGKSDYRGIDFKNYSRNNNIPGGEPDYYFGEKYALDLILPFEDDSFNHAVSFQVLEHHPDPEIMIRELARITKKGGLILITCPFIYALHEEPGDYQRLTHYKLKNIFEKNNCEMIRTKKQGGLFSVISTLLGEQLSRFAAKNSLNYLISGMLILPLLFLQYASILIDFFVEPKKVFVNYVILAKKI